MAQRVIATLSFSLTLTRRVEPIALNPLRITPAQSFRVASHVPSNRLTAVYGFIGLLMTFANHHQQYPWAFSPPSVSLGHLAKEGSLG